MRDDPKFQAALSARDEVRSILEVPPLGAHVESSLVHDDREVLAVWDYGHAQPRVQRLYAKSKTAQWDADRDLDWSIHVDPDAQMFVGADVRAQARAHRGPMSGWDDDTWRAYGAEVYRYTLSQFVHGEQYAMLTAAKIIEVAPTMDAKVFAAAQAADEARHVEAFSRYVNTKLGGMYPATGHLALLCEDILTDRRWDMTYLGMQVMVEGLALAMFSWMQKHSTEPLLNDMLTYVLRDEARHVAFGVLALEECYADMTDAELRERQELVFESALALRSRLVPVSVYERFDLPVARMARTALAAPTQQGLSVSLFSRIVPICSRIGLLDASGGWLRDRFGDLGVLSLEHEPLGIDEPVT